MAPARPPTTPRARSSSGARCPTSRREQLEPVLDQFRGQISQVPPAFSAIKVAGQRAYDLARRGDAPELEARPVTIHRLDLVSWSPPRLSLLVVCSKGTYIRSLARDLGEALGCGAHLTRLIRLWVGSFGLESAVSLDEIAAAASAGQLDRCCCRRTRRWPGCRPSWSRAPDGGHRARSALARCCWQCAGRPDARVRYPWSVCSGWPSTTRVGSSGSPDWACSRDRRQVRTLPEETSTMGERRTGRGDDWRL